MNKLPKKTSFLVLYLLTEKIKNVSSRFNWIHGHSFINKTLLASRKSLAMAIMQISLHTFFEF